MFKWNPRLICDGLCIYSLIIVSLEVVGTCWSYISGLLGVGSSLGAQFWVFVHIENRPRYGFGFLYVVYNIHGHLVFIPQVELSDPGWLKTSKPTSSGWVVTDLFSKRSDKSLEKSKGGPNKGKQPKSKGSQSLER